MTQANAGTLNSFSRLIATLESGGGSFAITLPSDWLQGRTAYGGLSAALCLEATLRAFPDLPPLRSAQFSFVAPATGVLRIAVNILRQGKSTVFTTADLEGENGVAARATFCFGVGRSIAREYANVPSPTAPRLEECPPYFTWPNQPNFRQHFEGRLAAGARTGTPGCPPEMLVWARHRDEDVSGGPVSLLALADALPPAALIMFSEPPPISTMTWSIDMLDAEPASTTGWWLVKCAVDSVHEGYSAQQTIIWNSDGRPILVARQNVAIFEKK
ncbi:thioesterase family protein [Cupriavidus necator]|uniref:Thioesterase family protein n=1 Tax=Cupriavidus necator TaxID=106590 RepID=A0A367PJK1_CUPNE|nr:thioesterase family protein [Cupriavidus necator]QQX86699.1 thioesterase family protein [Cupriavidus necator]RCJ07225.1 thioesterase family protein [Cupriavidus necator]